MNLLPLAGRLLASAGLGVIAASLPAFQAEGAEDRFRAAVARLRELAASDCGFFNPMHGWPHSDVLTLIDARESATGVVCGELEHLERVREYRPKYSKALYYVLGCVKDPAGADWILRRLATDPDGIYDFWLPCWQRRPSGPSLAERSWLEGAEEWSAVLRQLAKGTEDPSRQLLAIESLGQWFSDEGTREFFEELRARPDLDFASCLAVENFFDRLGMPVNGERIAAAIDCLGQTAEGRDTLIQCVRQMPNEAFVPWLVSIATEEVPEGSPHIQLQEITPRRDLQPEEWADWYATQADQGREAWVKAYFDELIREHGSDPEAARARFFRNKFSMANDRLVLLSLHRIAELPEFHDDVCTLVRWCDNETLREELESLVRQIEGSGGVCTCLAELAGPRVWLDDLPYPKGP